MKVFLPIFFSLLFITYSHADAERMGCEQAMFEAKRGKSLLVYPQAFFSFAIDASNKPFVIVENWKLGYKDAYSEDWIRAATKKERESVLQNEAYYDIDPVRNGPVRLSTLLSTDPVSGARTMLVRDLMAEHTPTGNQFYLNPHVTCESINLLYKLGGILGLDDHKDRTKNVNLGM